MKYILSLTLIAVFFVSCGSKEEKSVDELVKSGSLQELRVKKKELSTEMVRLKKQVSALDEKIEKLDKNKSKAIVSTMILKDTIFNHYSEIQGEVATDENIIIYPQFSGTLTQVMVKEGQKVSKGQVLARIDDGGMSSQLAQLQAQNALSKTTFERQKRLWDQKIGSEIQFLQAKTSYEASKNSLDQLQAQLGKSTVRAPFSGTIEEIITDQGSLANMGQTQLMRIVNLDNMYVTASVPESFLGKIKKGSDVIVYFSALDKEYTGKISQVSNYINPNNRSYTVQVNLSNKDGQLKPNLIATLKLNDYSSENTVTIPYDVVQKNGEGESLVFLYEKENETSGKVKQVKIKTGKEQNGQIEVTEGLKAGDVIVDEGARTLRDGEKVTVKSADNEQ